jgi:type I restriction enzyme S subunit
MPPPSERVEIVRILRALDDRIELNRVMNRTLEEIAQTIFRSWFVDFDGQTDLVESGTDLGVVPRGWEVRTLGDFSRLRRDTVDPAAVEADTPYIGLADMPQESIALSDWGMAADASSGKLAFSKGDILFGKLRPYFKKVGVAPIDGVCSSDILVLLPTGPIWFGILLGLLTYDPFIRFVSGASTGTRMPRADWQVMKSYTVALPPRERALEFNSLVASVVDRIHLNIAQSRTLASLRDTLLPKLISGEIRVPEAEQVVEDAV